MSNDYYTYTGTTPEGLAVYVTCSGYSEKPEEPRIKDIFEINGVDLEEVDPKIREMVLSGEISLTYTGGWCSGGSVWDAEGNDLEELTRIKEAFPLIQSVDPEVLRKALKLPA